MNVSVSTADLVREGTGGSFDRMESTYCDIGSSCAREVSIATFQPLNAKQLDHIDSVNVQRDITLLSFSSAYTDRPVVLVTRRYSSTHTYRAHDWHVLGRPGTKMADIGLADTAQLGPAGLPAQSSRDLLLEDLGFCCFGTSKSRAVRHRRISELVTRRDVFVLIDDATMHVLRGWSIFVRERLAENQQQQRR